MLIGDKEIIPDKNYTPGEVSDLLGLQLSTLACYRSGTNTGPDFIKFGRRILYPGSGLIAFLKASTRKSSITGEGEAA